MKSLLLLLCSIVLCTGCCDDDSTNQASAPVSTGKFTMNYNGEELEFRNIQIIEGGPDSGYDLQMHSVILYEDVPQTKHSLVLVFNKNDAEEYHLDNITFAVNERLSATLFNLKSFYAYTSGDFVVEDFDHSTSTYGHTEKITVNGSFEGTLLPHNPSAAPIEIEDGTFASVFTPRDEL
ncbi:hypothetical protein R1T16_12950 [Flavobacterium sp. DG1-102-2]|uniref:hypothetical protein n=1 Tax=Flavobacterium sp. DG1-102-2 TaxID=3081663 RepID=UPI002949B38C|nr:hypothetical protein [Flavobacterium sp. DG1-102-2]MDV6169337.1 hypothetical protein [Flavobacterium sp. DG1-102-2]